MPTVEILRFFPGTASAEDACNRIEAEITALKVPKSKRNEVYQRVLRNTVLSYIEEARAATNQAKKWRSIAEAMFWWADAFSMSSSKPFCQQAGADRNRANADDRALKAVFEWRDDPLRARRLSGLSDAEVIKRYLGQRVKPPRRQADRLQAMLKDGRMK